MQTQTRTAEPEWLKVYRAGTESRSRLPNFPVKMSRHARKRGKERCGLPEWELMERIKTAKAFQSDEIRWEVPITNPRRGKGTIIALAILVLNREMGSLVVVSILPPQSELN